MKFTWIAGPSFRLQLGPYVIIGDPVHADEFELDGTSVRRTHVLQPVETNDADLVLVTSARADHCDAGAIARCHTDQIYGPAGVPAAIQIAPGDSRRDQNDVPLTISPVPGTDGAMGFFLNLMNSERPFSAYITGDVLYSDEVRRLQIERGHLESARGVPGSGAEERTAQCRRQEACRSSPHAAQRHRGGAPPASRTTRNRCPRSWRSHHHLREPLHRCTKANPSKTSDHKDRRRGGSTPARVLMCDD
jgi:hypothetical protein